MLRVSTRLVTRRATMCRLYSNGSGIGGSEGATVSSRGGFSDKEKAVENQWARSHDEEKLRALREALEQQKQETDALKKDLDELKRSVKK
ncbi:hypothetical protein K492DRAFT_205219 [Lichtheimia hyalospora FSU 10163]|nr:hypothetical protein K492DRAFT_205219 [Lichtheimia hyalospora FSU 10163]